MVENDDLALMQACKDENLDLVSVLLIYSTSLNRETPCDGVYYKKSVMLIWDWQEP